MLQRNAGAYPLVFPTLVPPLEILPGGEIDHPELLPGCEPVVAAPPALPEAPAKRRPKTPAVGLTSEE